MSGPTAAADLDRAVRGADDLTPGDVLAVLAAVRGLADGMPGVADALGLSNP